jgi:gluconolactonase
MDNKLYELADGGNAKLIMDKSGGLDEMAPDSFQGSNGSIVDKDGSILMTQHGARRIVRLDDQMKLSVYLDKANGKRLNSPNDLAFTPDGALWFTDPPYGLVGQDKDPAKEQPFNAVWRHAGGKTTAVITDLPRPNGIGFSGDGKKLYISNSEPEMFVNVYDVNEDGTVSKGRRFITFPSPNPVDVPDGLEVDSAGNVWASGPGGIRIISPDGKVLGQIKTPDRAQANMIWGGADLKTLFIMAAGNVYKMRTEVAGLTPLYAKAPAK